MKRHKRLFMARAAMTLLLAVLTTVTAWASTFSGGSGTKDDPFKISTAADLVQLSNDINSSTSRLYQDMYFSQTTDIDLKGINFVPIGLDDDSENNNNHRFRGFYYGNNHAISNLTINGSYANAGLFGYSYNAEYYNIRLVSPSITNTKTGGSNTGALVGYANMPGANGCVVINPTINNSSGSVGVLAGSQSYGNFRNSFFIGDNDYKAVGSVGRNANSNIGHAYTLSLPAGVTVVSAVAVNHNNINYYCGTVTLSDLPDNPGWVYFYTVNGSTIEGTSFDITTNTTVTIKATALTEHFEQTNTNEYTIKTSTGWSIFCDMLDIFDHSASGGYCFDGKTVKLASDINITRAAGSSSYHDFTGIFEGQGHTINVDIDETETQGTAPFRQVAGGCTIRNVHVTGSVTGTTHASALIGMVAGKGTVTVENCLVEANVTVNTGTNKHCGGLVGHGGNSATVILRNTAYTGTITCGGNYAGGLQGWSDGNKLTIQNCLFAGSFSGSNNAKFHPVAIHYSGKTTNATVSDVCYTVLPTLDDASFIAASGKKTCGIASVPTTLGNTVGTLSFMTVYQHGLLFGNRYYTTPTLSTDNTGAYLIDRDDDWNYFCELLYDKDTYNHFSGKTVKLTRNISAQRMAGDSSHEFCGTFDGGGHTLSVSVRADGNGLAPFSCVNNINNVSAAIQNLNVAGTIIPINGGATYTSGLIGRTGGTVTISNCTVSGTVNALGKYAGGFVGEDNCTKLDIINCRSNVTIYSRVSGDGTHGGFIGTTKGSNVNITGCVFDGKILYAALTKTDHCAGFIGWNNGSASNVKISNSLFDPANANPDNYENWALNDGSANFCRNGATITNCYYTRDFNDGTSYTGQGKAARSVIAGNYVYVESIALTGNASETYSVSGITLYTGGGMSRTGKGWTNLYYGCDDQVSLTPRYMPRTGYDFNGFEASAGTLSGSMLTMPDKNVTIDAVWNAITYNLTYHLDGGELPQGESNPETYTIESADITLVEPTREPFIFGGWYANKEFTGDAVTTIATSYVGNKQFWAKWEIAYLDADGLTQYRTSATELTSSTDIGHLSAGWYVVTKDLSYSSQICCSEGDIHLILCDDAKMTVESNSGEAIRIGNGSITIYAQSTGSSMGQLEATATTSGIYAKGNITICGGNITATGSTAGICAPEGSITMHSGQISASGDNGIEASGITLGLRLATDHITASSYSSTSTVNIATGQRITDGTNFYNGNNVTIPANVTLTQANFTVNGDGTEYTIGSERGWDIFCDALNDNTTYNRFSGKTVKLGADISVTRMAGSSSHDFCGTFNGQGYTLNFNYGTAEAPAAVDYVAPFSYVSTTKADPNDAADSPAAFCNLHVSGDIYTSGLQAAGIIARQWGRVSITNCRVSINIHSSHSGDGTHGGLVACNNNNSLTIEGCMFDGMLLTTNGTTDCGGFLGWRNGAYTISNSLYAPTTEYSLAQGESCITNGATFSRNYSGTPANCYYTQPLGTEQGKQRRNITQGANVTIGSIALTGDATTYDVSGITAYSGGGLTTDKGATLYYGNGDPVDLTLSYTATDVPQGYLYAYAASAGTLNESTLTMPDEDVTVSLALVPIDWATVNQGTEGDPYIIYNKDQLLLLAHRVNGTHDETANDYEGEYFKLGRDIEFSYDANEGADYEENYEAIGRHYNEADYSFNGDFNGDGYTISGIRIRKTDTGDTDSNQGLFGKIANNAYIHHVHLTDALIKGYQNIGGIVGFNSGTVSGCTVTHSTIAATNYYGTICGHNSDTGTLTNNYYHGCTVNGTTSGKGCDGADVTENQGAVSAYLVNLGDGITIQTEMTDDLGFTYNGKNYWRNGAELTLGYSGDVPEFHTTNYATTGGTISGSTLTVAADATVSATVVSDGQSYSITYMKADGTTDTHEAVALDESMTTLVPNYDSDDDGTPDQGWYFVSQDISYNGTVTLEGDVNLILCDGEEMTVNDTADFSNAIDVSGDYTLTIFGQSEGTGRLTLTTGSNWSNAIEGNNIVINGGTVSANSASRYATIRGDVTLNGGQLNVSNTYDEYANDVCALYGDLTVNGGQFIASSNYGSTIIGASIRFNGGTFSATNSNGFAVSSYSVYLNWTNNSDSFYANSFDNISPEIAEGKVFIDWEGNLYQGHYENDTYYGYIDCFDGKTLRPFNGYYPPKNIKATSVTTNSAILTWEKGNDETQWQVNWSTDKGSTWTTPVTVNSTQYEIINLDPETTVQVQVLSVYGENQYSNSNSITFTTHSTSDAPVDLASNATAKTATLRWTGFQEDYNVRYAESLKTVDDFENAATFANWTTISNNEANSTGDQGYGRYDDDGNYCFRFSSFSRVNESEDYNQYLISPELNGILSMEFYYKGHSDGEAFKVGYSTTGKNVADFDFGDEIVTCSAEWVKYSYTLPAGTKYVAINYYSNYKYYLYVDNITLTGVGSWENVNDATNPQTITGLKPETNYMWQVQGILDNDVTEWSTGTFTTLQYYIDENGEEQTLESNEYTVLTGNETPDEGGVIRLHGGWYVVKGEISYSNMIEFDADTHIILCDGCQMTFENPMHGIGLNSWGDISIYGQSAGTGSFNGTVNGDYHSSAIFALGNVTINGGIVNAASTASSGGELIGGIIADKNVTINGGIVNATSTASSGEHIGGIIGNNITLGWTNASDYINANNYYIYFNSSTVKIATGKAFIDEDGTIHTSDNVGTIDGKTLRPYANVTIAIGGAGIKTYASPYDLDFTDVEGLTAYVASDISGNKLTLTPVDYAPAGTGLLLRGTANGNFTVPTTASATAITDNMLVGVLSAETIVQQTETVDDVDYTNFILANGSYGIDWYTLSEAGSIGANKAYLRVPTSTLAHGARPTMVFEDVATGVHPPTISPEEERTEAFPREGLDGVWLTLDGVRLNGKPTQKGLYIYRGKKVVIR